MNLDAIASQFNAVIKYAAGDHLMSPIGFPMTVRNHPEKGTIEFAAHAPRGIVADAVDEANRPEEADILRNHDGPVLLHQGKVKKGRYSYDQLLRNIQAVHEHLADVSEGQWEPDYDFTAHRNEMPDEISRRRLKPDHFRVWSTTDDDPDELPFDDVHIKGLGNHLADRIEESYNHGDYGWNTDGNSSFTLDYGLNDGPEMLQQTHSLRSALMHYLQHARGHRSIEQTDHREAIGRLLHGHQHYLDDLHDLQGALTQYSDSADKTGNDDASYYANLANFHLHSIIDAMQSHHRGRLDELDRRLAVLRQPPVELHPDEITQ